MYRSTKRVAGLLFLGIFSMAIVSTAFAADGSTEQSLTGFFRRLFNYPVKATKETAGMTANTLQNTGEKVVKPMADNTAAVVTGKIEKVGDLVAEPVKGTLETAGQTTAETVQVPVKAAEEEMAGKEEAKN